MPEESYLYKKLADNDIQREACSHYCIIKNNKKGKCLVRQNSNGILHVLNYSQTSGLAIDPIEKTFIPFYDRQLDIFF